MTIGILFIISAPSGSGKTTIISKVLKSLSGLAFSVSHTTREPRISEQNGIDYHFVDNATFIEMREKHAFLEWAEVHGRFYGTSQESIQKQLSNGTDVILDIDVQGAAQIRKNYELQGVSIFIVPPSFHELERRLVDRGTDSADSIKVRCSNARMEITSSDKFDYLIVNDSVDDAVEILRSVIIAERSKNRRFISGAPVDMNKFV